jgi:hypothetical protein
MSKEQPVVAQLVDQVPPIETKMLKNWAARDDTLRLEPPRPPIREH